MMIKILSNVPNTIYSNTKNKIMINVKKLKTLLYSNIVVYFLILMKISFKFSF
jgi:hypothetical protein